jgi:hypothetical protein
MTAVQTTLNSAPYEVGKQFLCFQFPNFRGGLDAVANDSVM